MPKALCVYGLIVAGLLLLLFGVDLLIGVPFGKASMMMDVGGVVVSALLGYLSWSTLVEQQ